MFKRDVQQIKNLILRNLRAQGLETPLLQKRLIDAWPEVAGEMIAGYTRELTDLSMMRSELVKKLNAHVGSQVIADIRFC